MRATPVAKFQPPPRRAGLLARPRLVDALHQHLDRKLQVVVAPAGFGKTTLLAEFVAGSALSMCWVALDRTDRDLIDFVEVMAGSLRRQFPDFGKGLATALDGGSDVERRIGLLARAFAAEAEETLTAPVVVVLDDFHEVNDSQPVTEFVGALLRVLPEKLRIVVAARTLPNLPLSRLVLRDEVYGLGEADLRFTTDELLMVLDLREQPPLATGHAEDLASGAEGWISGFLLSVPQLREGLLGGTFTGRGGQGLLYDYLADEAFDRQPPDVQRFLLASSTPDLPDTDICAALLGRGDWAAIRAYTEGAGLFLTRVGAGSAFRYHQLFRAFLQDRLRRADPFDYHRLHALTATLLAGEGDWQRALEHFREAESPHEAVALLAGVAPALEEQVRWRALDDAANGFEVDVLVTEPSLLLGAAWAAQMAGNHTRAGELAHAACSEGARAGDGRLEARGLARLGMLHRMQGRTAAAIETLTRASALAGSDDELVATIRLFRGQCFGDQGDLLAAADEFRGARRYFGESGPVYREADAEIGLAITLERSGRLPEAASRYESARNLWRRAGNSALEANALAALGSLQVQQGDYGGAGVTLGEALRQAEAVAAERARANALLAHGRLLLLTGEVSAARMAWEQGLAALGRPDVPSVRAELLDGLALAAVFEGDAARAEKLAREAVALAERHGSCYQQARFALTLGGILSRAGRDDALPILQQAADALARMGAAWAVADSQLWLAQAHHQAGSPAAARHHLRTALRMADDLGSDAVLDLHVRWDATLFRETAPESVAPHRLIDALVRAGEAVRAVPASRAPDTSHESAGGSMAVQAFGAGVVTLDGQGTVDWGRDKPRELFFLLLHGGPRRQEQLTEILWPDASPERAQSTFYTTVHRLRKIVHPRVIVRSAGAYRVNEDVVARYDAREFERSIADAAAVDGAASVTLLERAMVLYVGPFLQDMAGEWCEAERDRLERQYLLALDRLAAIHTAAGRHRECIAVCERTVALDPFREDAHARIIRAHLALGDRTAARRALDKCTATLRDELGVGPGADVQLLARAIDSETALDSSQRSVALPT